MRRSVGPARSIFSHSARSCGLSSGSCRFTGVGASGSADRLAGLAGTCGFATSFGVGGAERASDIDAGNK